MRERMEEMQRQIEEFVSTLNTEMHQRVKPSERESGTALIPVIDTRHRK